MRDGARLSQPQRVRMREDKFVRWFAVQRAASGTATLQQKARFFISSALFLRSFVV